MHLPTDHVDDSALLSQIQFTLNHGFVIAASTPDKNNVRFKEMLEELRQIAARKNISRLSDNQPTEIEEYADYMRTVKSTAKTKLSCPASVESGYHSRTRLVSRFIFDTSKWVFAKSSAKLCRYTVKPMPRCWF